MTDQLVAVVFVPALVGAVMVFFLWLTSRDTAAAARGDLQVQDRGRRRLGVFYDDPTDPRTWVPRPHGNGWDPNIATTGGKIAMAFIGLLLAAVVLAAVSGLLDSSDRLG